MATPSQWSCPICHDTREGLALVVPCLHEFCFGRLMRWAMQDASCPLCTGPIRGIKFSVWEEDDFLAYSIVPPSPQAVDGGSGDGAPGRPDAGHLQGPRASLPPAPQEMPYPAEQRAAGMAPRGPLGGLDADAWAVLFHQHHSIFESVLPWLRQELQEIHGDEWWKAVAAESLIVSTLCMYGLDEEALLEALAPNLQHRTQTFVHQLMEAIVRHCSEEARRLLCQEDSRALRGQGGCPVNIPETSSSSSGPYLNEFPSTSDAVLQGSPKHPLSAAVPEQREEVHEELEQEAAGPSGQGCSRSPAAASQSRESLPGGPRRTPKRRASSPWDSPPPCKRPRKRRH